MIHWLTETNEELYDRGLDPKDRLSMCGHVRALAPVWASTVGMWGGHRTAKDILTHTGVSRTAYNAFRHRHKLQTAASATFGREWFISSVVYADMLEIPETTGVSDGVRANALSKRYKSGMVPNLGILPAEILIRYETMKDVLSAGNITLEDYNSDILEDADRAVLYLRGERFSFYGLR